MADETTGTPTEETAPVTTPDLTTQAAPAVEPETEVVPIETPAPAASTTEPVIEAEPVSAPAPAPVLIPSTPPVADPYPNLRHITPETAHALREKSKAAVAARTAARLEAVMSMFADPRHKSYLKIGIANDDVQLALGVSDAVASRYLTALVKAGRLMRIGKGNATRYRVQGVGSRG